VSEVVQEVLACHGAEAVEAVEEAEFIAALPVDLSQLDRPWLSSSVFGLQEFILKLPHVAHLPWPVATVPRRVECDKPL